MNSVYEFKSDSPQQTKTLAAAMAECLTGGTVVALNGDLGAGKTTLTRGICEALGIEDHEVNSPTFVLLQLYPSARFTVAHFDTYRLADPEEFLAVGGEDYLLSAEHVCLVEWAERIKDILPTDHLQITLSHTGPEARRFEVIGTGVHSCRIVTQIREKMRGQSNHDSRDCL